MSHSANILKEVDGLLNANAKAALAELHFETVNGNAFNQILARLRQHVPPSYLPFASFDGAALAFHLFPGRELAQCPIVYIGIGSRSPKFVCRNVADLAIGAWLWVAPFFQNRVDTFRSAINTLCNEIAIARPVPPELWQLLEQAPEGEPTWLGYGASPLTSKAWKIADVGHPFADLYQIDFETPRKLALDLQMMITSQADTTPQLLAALLAAQSACDEKPDQNIALRLLICEAWLGGEPALRTDWHFALDGLGEWSLALKFCDPETLADTPFESLLGHPDAYSGKDPGSHDLLQIVASAFSEKRDYATEVRQLRNAAFVSLFIFGEYDDDACVKIAAACNRLSTGCSAQQLALAYADVSGRDA